MSLAKQIEVLWVTLPPVFVITALLAIWGPSLFGKKSQRSSSSRDAESSQPQGSAAPSAVS